MARWNIDINKKWVDLRRYQLQFQCLLMLRFNRQFSFRVALSLEQRPEKSGQLVSGEHYYFGLIGL